MFFYFDYLSNSVIDNNADPPCRMATVPCVTNGDRSYLANGYLFYRPKE